MHRPGSEMNVVGPSKRIEAIGSFGDLDAGWYWQSDTIPPVARCSASALRRERLMAWHFFDVAGQRKEHPFSISNQT
jgi:hypothetical protein